MSLPPACSLGRDLSGQFGSRWIEYQFLAGRFGKVPSVHGQFHQRDAGCILGRSIPAKCRFAFHDTVFGPGCGQVCG